MNNSFHRPVIAAIAALCLGASVSQAAKPPQTYTFPSARKPGSLDHVAVKLEVGGELKEREHAGAKTTSMPLSVVCEGVYDEKTLEIPTTVAGRWRSVRSYEKAAATIKRTKELASCAPSGP